MRTVTWFIWVVCFLVGSLPRQKKAGRLLKKGNYEEFRKITDEVVTEFALGALKHAGVEVEVHGQENLPDRPAVYIANHQSNWDIPLMLAFLGGPHGLVSKDSLAKIPIVNTWMIYIDCVFLDRKNPRKALLAMNEAGSVIPKGRSICVFPEGTRSRGEEMGEFKHGAIKTAFKYHAPIVPIAIDGTYKVMEANGGRIKPARVRMTILPPVETDGLDKAQQKEFSEKLRQMVLDAREASRREYGEIQ